MIDNNSNASSKSRDVAGMLMNFVMAILTLAFVILYAAAFSGKLDPLKNNTMLLYLEPVIFILIGYYFGRFPSRQTEQTLTEEITRQTQKADAAQYAKEKAHQQLETLEEKIKNARLVLRTPVSVAADDAPNVQSKTVKTAMLILDS